MKRILPWVLAANLILAPALLIGCDSSDTNADENSTTAEGHLRILLKDAPADIAAAFVTIERIEFIGDFDDDENHEGDDDDQYGEDEDGKFVVVFDEPQTLDLLTLQDGVTVTLVDTEVPFGNYRQIRWYVGDDAYVVLNDGEQQDAEMDLKIPSGKIKIQLPEFDVDNTDDLIEILFDFNVDKSFVQRGNSGKGFIFKPTIKPEHFLINGTEVDLGDFDDDEDDG